jgi:Zn-dependent protease
VSVLEISSYPIHLLATFLITLVYLNIGLGVFNLIPIPPLDGSKILGEFLSGGAKYKYLSFERYGSIVLLLVFAIRPLNNIFSSFLGFLQGFLLSGYLKIIEFILGVF